MTIEESGLRVEVTGPPDSGKTLVCSVITRALIKAGFRNVVMTDQQSEVVEPIEVRTMLDLLAIQRPEILTQRIDVIETTELEEQSEVVELSDITLRLGEEELGDSDDIASLAVLEEDYSS